MPGPPRSLVAICLAAVIVLAATRALESGAYIFAGEANGLDVITHPQGYTGTGGPLNISVAIDPTSANASSMEISVQNIVNTFNALVATTGNVVIGGGNNITPSNAIDFESVALHELGHSLGLAHVNAASESGLSGNNQNYTKATDGVNDGNSFNTADFNLNNGADNVIGSSDDIRGDDVNLHWFRISNNNPFTIPGTVDGTTYSRDTADLPSGHTFATNADRTVSTLLGVPNTEAVMQQGTSFDEAQRTLTHDDVATLRIGMAGLDETAGTSDDYTLILSFAGQTTSADIVLDFDTASGLASSNSNGFFIGGTDHVRIFQTSIRFSNVFTWFFNDVSNDTCTFSASPTSESVVSAGGSDSVAVTAGTGCMWTAVSNAAFLNITGGASGTGDGTVSYTAAANTTTSRRSGTMTVAGQTVTVTQNAGFANATLTTVQAVDFNELRTRIDALRSALSLSAVSYTNTVVVGGMVEAVDVTEMRAGLVAAYAAASQMAPSFTDPSLGTGDSILAVHITELRAAVEALELVVL